MWEMSAMKNVKDAKCVRCGREYPARPDLTLCACGGVLDIRYNYAYIRTRVSRAHYAACPDVGMWRYRDFLPVEENTPAPPLRVGGSPLYEEPRLADMLGIGRLWLKDDGQNPTASLKDRASAMAVAKAWEAGAKTIACSSTGNAASSLAGNAAAAGFSTVIFVPARAPIGKVAQLKIFGATVISVEGSYEDTFRLSAEAIDKYGWYNRNAAVNPYLVEGKKTVAFEIAEQCDWVVPDYVAVSVGDGCTIAGVWKGFGDLHAAGLIDRLPKLLSVQAAGCCPINRAARTGEPLAPMPEDTIADSIAVGVPRNPDKAIRAIRESRGLTIEVTDEEILDAMRFLGKTCGVFGEPAGVAATAGLRRAAREGLLSDNATVVSIVTGNGLKDTANGIRAAGEPIRLPPVMALLEEVLRDTRGMRSREPKKLGCVFLASGHAKRFGRDKLRYPLDGKAICAHCFDNLPSALFVSVCVVARHDEVLRLAALRGFLPVWNPDETDDPARTIRLGLENLPADLDGVLFCVCDQPYLRPESIARLAAAFAEASDRIVRLSWRGAAGNPVLFPASLLPDLRALPPFESGRHVIARHGDRVVLVEAQDPRELHDIDRQEDLL